MLTIDLGKVALITGGRGSGVYLDFDAGPGGG